MSLELINLSAQAPSQALFSGINATIGPADVLAVMGPSGSGKTTLLNLIAGFADPPVRWGGQVWLAGERLCHQPPHKRRLGLVFQSPLLFPHLSVGQNLGFGVPGNSPPPTVAPASTTPWIRRGWVVCSTATRKLCPVASVRAPACFGPY